MRKLLMLVAVGTLAAVTPRAGEAQVQLGPTLSIHDDFDFGVGATMTVQMPALGEGLGFMGDFLIFFPDADGLDYLEFNGNVTYDFELVGSTVRPFTLVGLNIARVSVDLAELGDDSNTEIGLNVGGGIAFDLGSFRPQVGGRFEIDGGDGFVFFATLPFEVAGR